MDQEIRLLPIAAIAGLAVLGCCAYLLLRKPREPKYSIPSDVWGCDQDCRCDELHITDIRYFDGEWQYWVEYPEGMWIPESQLDAFVAQGQLC